MNYKDHCRFCGAPDLLEVIEEKDATIAALRERIALLEKVAEAADYQYRCDDEVVFCCALEDALRAAGYLEEGK